jgi:SNARE associated Golgi protein
MAHNGTASVFLARFTAVVRAFVPLVAGILRMSPGRFYAANVLSALIWAPIHGSPRSLRDRQDNFSGQPFKPLVHGWVIACEFARQTK